MSDVWKIQRGGGVDSTMQSQALYVTKTHSLTFIIHTHLLHLTRTFSHFEKHFNAFPLFKNIADFLALKISLSSALELFSSFDLALFFKVCKCSF